MKSLIWLIILGALVLLAYAYFREPEVRDDVQLLHAGARQLVEDTQQTLMDSSR